MQQLYFSRNIKKITKFVLVLSHETAAVESYFILRKTHPNFKDLFKKIFLGKTYKITYKYFNTKWSLIIDDATIFEIVNIEDCVVNTIEYTLVSGFSGVENCYTAIYGRYLEVFIDKPISNNARLLINTKYKHKLVKQQRYDLKYIKYYLLDFYLITSITHIT